MDPLSRRLLDIYGERSTADLRADLRGSPRPFRELLPHLPSEGVSMSQLVEELVLKCVARNLDLADWIEGMESRYHPGEANPPLHVCVDRTELWSSLRAGSTRHLLIPALPQRGLRFLLHRVARWGGELGWKDVVEVRFPDTPPVDGVSWFWRRLAVALGLDEFPPKPEARAFEELRRRVQADGPLVLLHRTVSAYWSYLPELADYHADLAAALTDPEVAGKVGVLQGFQELPGMQEFPPPSDALQPPGLTRLPSLPEIPEADFVAFIRNNDARVGPVRRRPALDALKGARQTDDRFIRLADALGEPPNGDIE